MPIGLAIFAGCLASVFGIIALHECGHFLAGLLAGIPFGQMKVRLTVFPQHVALSEGQEWLSPVGDHARYVARAKVLIRSRCGAIGYVAGGLLAQTAVFLAFVWVCRATDVPRVWQLPLTCSLVSVPALYFVADLLATGRTRRPCGDFSGLWEISPMASVLVTGLTLGAHTAGLIYVFETA